MVLILSYHTSVHVFEHKLMYPCIQNIRTTPTFLSSSLQTLCAHRSLITDAERWNPAGSSRRPRSRCTAPFWWMKAIRSSSTRKRASVNAALPSSRSDTVIYWAGASCHEWVMAAETVWPREAAAFKLGSCFTAALRWLCSSQHCGLRWSYYKC